MASSKIKGITIEIGGNTTKLGKAIAESEKQTRSLQGELKQVEKLLEFDPGNTELLAQKQKILSDAVKETTDKLETLRKAEEQVIEQFNKGDIGEDQLRAFQREIIKTQSELDDFESKLNGTGDKIEDVGESAEKSSDGFTIMGGALADLTANAISGAISAIGDFIGSLFELSEATEEYRTMQAKLEGSANTFGYSIDFANGKYKEFYKYLGDDQASTNAITNLMGIGTNTESLSKLVEGATGAWATYGDSINVESLTEAINETITCGKVTGSFADTINWCKDANVNLKDALGGNKKAQKAYNDALKEGLPVEDAFNEALAKITDEQERADVVAQFLNSTYGESKKTYDELNSSVMDANEAELALKETQAQLGETMSPVNTAITNLKNQALQAIVPLVQKCADAFLNLLKWLKEHPTAMKVLTAVVIALGVAFGVLATALGIQALITGVTKAFAFLNTTLLANPIVLIIAAIAGLVAGFIYLWNNCEAFRNFWIGLWEKIKSVTATVIGALKVFFTQTIPDLINKIVNWFKSLPEKVRSAISSMVEKVKTTFNNVKNSAINITNNVISSVTNFFKQLPGKIWSAIVGAVSRVATWGSQMKSKAVSAITSLISNVISRAKQLPGKIWSAIQGAISKVKSWGSSLISTAGSAIRNMVTKVVEIAKELPGKFLSIGGDIIEGIKNGIGGAIGGLYESIKSGLSGLVDKAKEALGINSPSKIFAEVVGKAIPEGIAKGIGDNSGLASDAVQGLGDNLGDQAFSLNGATINRQLATTFNGGNTGLASDNSALLSKLDGIYERLNRLQIVLDTGTLVGETIDKYDAVLSGRQTLKARGV